MSHIAPPLTAEGFRRGCTQPGDVRPLTRSVDLGNATLHITASGIIIATEDPFLLKRICDAKCEVGNHDLRVNRSR